MLTIIAKSELLFNIIIHCFKKKRTYTSITRQLIGLVLWRSRFDNESPLGFDLLSVVAYLPVVPPVLGRFPLLIFSPTPFHGISSCPELDIWSTVAMQLKLSAISCFDSRRRNNLSPTFLRTWDRPETRALPPRGSFLWTIVPICRLLEGVNCFHSSN